MTADDTTWPDTVDLTVDTWIVEGQWGPRADDPAECAERLLACLAGLASVDPGLSKWFDDAGEVPVTEPDLRRLVDQGWDRETPTGEMGTTVSLWNGIGDDLGVATLGVSCGATASYLRNNLELVPPKPAAAPGLYTAEAMLGLVDTLVSAWQPRWCRVRPMSLGLTVGSKTFDAAASWIAYLDHEVHTRTADLPDGVRVLDFEGVGDVFVLASTPQDLRLSVVDAVRERVVFPDSWDRLR